MFAWLKRTVVKAAFKAMAGVTSPASWFVTWARGGSESSSGVTVNEETAIGYAPVWYAVSRIAGHVSTLPVTPMKRLPEGGAEKDLRHPSYRLVRTRANPYQSAAQFWETLMVHVLLNGNGKAVIQRDDTGRPVELLLMPPRRSLTAYVNGEKWHAVRAEPDERLRVLSGDNEQWVKYPDSDVLHIPGLGLDGTVGLETYTVSKDTFGIGLAAEQATGNDFANGSKPGVILQAPQGVLRDAKDADEFVDNWNQHHMGSANRGRTGLLKDGITATILTTSNQDAQWVEQRTFQRQEVALLFSLESILGDDSSVSYNSVEAKHLAYLTNCLMRFLVKVEQECDEKLLSPRQKVRNSHFFKFNTAALLRSDFKTTVEALGILVVNRVMNPNEAREKLDMNPYPGGDEFANPAITPGKPGSEDAEEEEEETVTPEDANRRAIVAHLRHRIGVEVSHVVRAAGNKPRYVSWLDHFYTNKWQRTMCNAVENIGGPRSLGEDHCSESMKELIDIAGTVGPEGLADAVAETTENWPDRAEQLADQIVGGLINA